ncbi:MAG TPA: hypothetical protein VFP61_02620 [Acidimicrobiales bacterium]|nr:hypothetical protein [Acidimicrobiales bacterium]
MSEDSVANLPDSLTLDESFRAAFYMVLQYLELKQEPSEDIVLLTQYLWTDSARWQDWLEAVRRALSDGGLADPDHEGVYKDRPDMPYVPKGGRA